MPCLYSSWKIFIEEFRSVFASFPTVSVNVAVFSPTVKVITATPSPTAVTTPLSTVATSALSEVHARDNPSAFLTVGTRVTFCPTVTLSALLSSDTETSGASDHKP